MNNNLYAFSSRKPGEPCECDWTSVRDLLSRLGDKWTFMVVAVLANDRMRFKELFRAMEGISQRMLTVTLRNLERDGFVNRIVYPTIPPKVEYELSDRGRSLRQMLMPLGDWAMANHPGIQESRQLFDCEHRQGA